MLDFALINAKLLESARISAFLLEKSRQVQPVLWSALERTAEDWKDESSIVRQKIREAQAAHRYSGAIPAFENPVESFTTDAQPLRVFGVDGSQIYPNGKSPVIWSYIQAIAYGVGDGIKYKAARFFTPLDLYSDGRLVSEEIINMRRNLLEMEVASLASQQENNALVILDGALLPFASETISHQEVQLILSQYARCLFQSRLICGVISSPRSYLLNSLACLALQAFCEHDQTEPPPLEEWKHAVTDRSFMNRLKVGERSALFLYGSPRNEKFIHEGAGVYFFSLRIKSEEIVRVEIPEWVAKDADLVRAVHATVFHDSAMTGYSYALSQAHNNVVIPRDVARQLQLKAEREMFSLTDDAYLPSAKDQFKTA